MNMINSSSGNCLGYVEPIVRGRFRPMMLAILSAFASDIACSAPVGWAVEPVAPTTVINRGLVLVVSPTGRQHILYYYDDTTGGRGQMRHLMRAPSEVWDATAATTVAGNGSHVPSLALDQNGVPYAAYSESSDETERLRVLSGSGWVDFGSPLPSGYFVRGGMGGRVRIDRQGRPSLAYFYGTSESAYLSEWNGAAWITTVVETGDRVGKGPSLALTRDDRPLLTYFDQDKREMHFAERDASGAWLPIVGFGAVIYALGLTTGGDGEPVLVGITPDETNLLLFERIGGVWSKDTTFPGAGHGYHHGRVVVDSDNNVRVVIANHNSGRIGYLKRIGTTWHSTIITSGVSASDSGRFPDIAVTPEGATVIAYVRFLDGMVMLATEHVVPPVITVPDNIVAEAMAPSGASVTFQATASDVNDGPLPVTLSPDSGTVFPLGTTTVSATATNSAGYVASAFFTVTVRDTTPPIIRNLTATPAVLWPPNHRMVAVTLSATVFDAVDISPTTTITSVTSNEPISASDWEVIDNLSLKLRAERAGSGSGRTYSITVESRDASGNRITNVVPVSVPKAQGKK